MYISFINELPVYLVFRYDKRNDDGFNGQATIETAGDSGVAAPSESTEDESVRGGCVHLMMCFFNLLFNTDRKTTPTKMTSYTSCCIIFMICKSPSVSIT